MLLTYQNIIAPLQLQPRASKPSRRKARTHDCLGISLSHAFLLLPRRRVSGTRK
ncbi:hypothetical protein F4776DRAFT_626361 [Hypoxylon sp. NC0597]|nr:hypothetical protein F4776DRAFT_626361 [Hypoxylon sp. NC0597]